MVDHARVRRRGRTPRLPVGLTACVVAALALVAMTTSPAGASHRSSSVATAPVALAASASTSGGLAPQDIHAAYALPNTGPKGQLIAVVSAYDDPRAQSDLNSYTSEFGLASCKAPGGCFRKVNQGGHARPLPAADPTGGNWVTEAALGTQVARGVCQSCAILLVEADSASKADLSAAVNTAARMGANVVVTSFSPPEQPGDGEWGADYTHPHTVVVAATGDGGYTGSITFPAGFANVLAVGGTQLELTRGGQYAGERAWSSNGNASGSGCSSYATAPAWQSSLARAVGCSTQRAVADISAVADPGALIHIGGLSGGPWFEAGGTSLSAPIIAGVLGLAGGGSGNAVQRLYEQARTDPGALRDVTTGSTNPLCAGKPICAARRGYDGPTGLGTPDGLAAFMPSGGAVDPRHPSLAVTAPRGRIRASSHWVAKVGLQNGNGFAVSVSVAIDSARRLTVGSRAQLVEFAAARLKLGPLAGGTVSLTIARRYRALAASAGGVSVVLKLHLRGPTGRNVSLTKGLRLSGP